MVRRPNSGNRVLNEEAAGLGVLLTLPLSVWLGWAVFGTFNLGAGVTSRAVGGFDNTERSLEEVIVDFGSELGPSWAL